MKLKLKKLVLKTDKLLKRKLTKKRLKKILGAVLTVALRLLVRKLLEGALDGVFPPGANRRPGRSPHVRTRKRALPQVTPA